MIPYILVSCLNSEIMDKITSIVKDQSIIVRKYNFLKNEFSFHIKDHEKHTISKL